MNDIENEGPETRSRKRRSSGGSALTDISNIGTNFLQQSFNFVGKKLAGSKKRRTSVSMQCMQSIESMWMVTSSVCLNLQGEDVHSNDTTVVIANNPVVSSSSGSAVVEHTAHNNSADAIHEVFNLRSESEDRSVATISNESRNAALELSRFGFVHPSLPRKIPLALKGADPCDCLDVYDDIYGFLVENEVSSDLLDTRAAA